MDLAIVVLCWRSQRLVPELLRSIAAQRTRFEFEVVICHNEANPGLIAADAPAGIVVHEIVTGANLGYGGGNNFAIAWAGKQLNPRYFWVLNSDVVLHDGALDAIVGWADRNPQVAAAGAVHEDPSRPGYRCYGGCRYNKALSTITPNSSPYRHRLDYVHGAAVLLRAEVFADRPVFAEHYFLFFEELDLANRVKAWGKRIGYCPECRISHFEGGSRTRSNDDFLPEVAEYFENLNALRFTRDHAPHFLPTVLLFRGAGKFVYLCLTANRHRLVFWALALHDFFRSRVRRFPFQAGWEPMKGKDRVVDAPWPRRK